MVRVPGIVLIKQSDQRALGVRGAEVARGRLPPVGFAKQPDRMALSESFDDSRAVVRRTVVDHNEFVRGERLRKHALDGLLNPLRSVVERNDCGNGMIKMCLCHLIGPRRPAPGARRPAPGESTLEVTKCQGPL